jgi:hypothetical protein
MGETTSQHVAIYMTGPSLLRSFSPAGHQGKGIAKEPLSFIRRCERNAVMVSSLLVASRRPYRDPLGGDAGERQAGELLR